MATDTLQIQTSDAAPGIRIITLTGPLVLGTMFEFQSDLRRSTNDSLVIDLAGVPYMDSAGLGCLLGGMSSCQRNHRGFALCGVSERILTLLNISGVETLVPMYPDAEAATAALKSKVAGK